MDLSSYERPTVTNLFRNRFKLDSMLFIDPVILFPDKWFVDTSRRKSVENLVISSQDAIGQSISQALTFSGVITQHTNQILQETK
ncbi:hypothetical protein MSG28_009476 [Choristoneura fumiferana]|uniref:Uncharacterized protein n=1 Tax=Choristoneura fumiferana TaxID=7141 RepID=A0ACC0JBG0_CHOFU|nr:hypothetical protein MSG28_009476 [Choristoneura fumiferana]